MLGLSGRDRPGRLAADRRSRARAGQQHRADRPVRLRQEHAPRRHRRLHRTSRGRILWNGPDLTTLPPAARPVTLLFQEHNLFAHLTAAQNVGLGLRPDLRLDRAAARGSTRRSPPSASPASAPPAGAALRRPAPAGRARPRAPARPAAAPARRALRRARPGAPGRDARPRRPSARRAGRDVDVRRPRAGGRPPHRRQIVAGRRLPRPPARAHRGAASPTRRPSCRPISVTVAPGGDAREARRAARPRAAVARRRDPVLGAAATSARRRAAAAARRARGRRADARRAASGAAGRGGRARARDRGRRHSRSPRAGPPATSRLGLPAVRSMFCSTASARAIASTSAGSRPARSAGVAGRASGMKAMPRFQP